MPNIAQAIINEIKAVEAEPAAPINLLAIGPSLVSQGFSQHEIVDALFAMQRNELVELMPGNHLRLTHHD